MATLEKVLDSSRAAVGTSPVRTWSCAVIGSRTSAWVRTKRGVGGVQEGAHR